MKKFILFASLILMMSACTASKNTTVSYKVADNYYFRNDAQIPASPKITSKADFFNLFGMAPVMGKNGEPTSIDFSRQFVIAKVLPETDIVTEINPVSLTKEGNNTLILKYNVKREKKTTWTMQPFFILIVDNKYKDCTIKE
jgi:hypothetical protein